MLSINIEPISGNAIILAVKLLSDGKLVAFPTETVYGLGGDATNDAAVAEIFAVKGRPEFNPLIVHVSDVSMAQRLVEWNEAAQKLANAFWPGPLTLVLPRLPDSPVSLLASAGGDTLGVRCPAQASARALIMAAGIPLAAPSANRSGRVSPTTAQHVYEELGNDVPLILDGGACEVGIESTVIDISSDAPVLLRPGFIAAEQIEAVLGRPPHPNPLPIGEREANAPRERVRGIDYSEQQVILKSPGMLASHYAPSLPVRLNVTKPKSKEALLAFGDSVPKGAKATFNLSKAGDLEEAAANLFVALRAHDKPDYSAIAVMPIPEEGLGLAINDRLKRAAAR